MKSVKPGRGPSFMGGIGYVFGVFFCIFWTVMANQMGAPVFFSIFGVLGILACAASAIYQFMNATRKKRFSAFDITTDGEEPDPLNERFSEEPARDIREAARDDIAFCPYCGEKVEEGYRYCRKCGKELPNG